MSKAKKFLTIGIWTAVLPFLGFPLTIKNILFVLTGFLIMYMSYRIYLENKKLNTEVKTDSFSENIDFNKTEEKVN